MTTNKILNKVDHTLLSQTATWEDIKTVLDDAVKYETASACIPPTYVKQAVKYLKGRNSSLPVCTVIGFPNGYSTTAVKVFEARDAVQNGASEIDMVINIGMLKDKKYAKVEDEIHAVHEACDGRVLKVIIETCLLTKEEKILLCQLVSQSKADYIKTSTGFSTGGATKEDIALMRAYCAPSLKIKAAGGIGSLEDAEDFLRLGADRLGTSRIIKLAEKMQNRK